MAFYRQMVPSGMVSGEQLKKQSKVKKKSYLLINKLLIVHVEFLKLIFKGFVFSHVV